MERSARRLLLHCPGDAHMVLGMIADLRRDPKTAIQAHAHALQYGRTPVRVINYAGTLGRFHRPHEGLEQLMSLFEGELGMTDPLALLQAIRTAHSAGRFHQAAAFLAKYRQMALPEEADITAIGATLPALVDAANVLELTDDAMAAIQESAWQAIREEDPSGRLDVRITDRVLPYEGLYISRTYWLPISPEEGYAVNDRMIEIWAASDNPPSIDDFCPVIRGRSAA
ncbi:MAG: hypothetical protein ABTR07_17535 [Candidatus Competibacter denitrificans]